MPPLPDSASRVSSGLRLAFLTPVGLLVVLGLLFGRQILHLVEDSEAVVHSQQVLGAAYQTQLQIADQEVGSRGYLLTREARSLALFDRATPRAGFERLRSLTADNPGQQVRFDEARQRYEAWLAAISPALQGEAAGADRGSRDDGRMAVVRDGMREATEREDTLQRERAASLAATTTRTKVMFPVLLAGAAALLAWLSRRQLRTLTDTSHAMLAREREARAAVELEEWIRNGLARLVQVLQGERTLEQLGADTLAVVAPYAGADVGALFTREAGGWQRRAGYSLDARSAGPGRFAPGEGLVGQVAVSGEPRHLREVPPDALRVSAGTTETSPVELMLIPACLEGVTHAVLELGFLRPADDRTVEMLGRLGPTLAFAVRSAEYKQQLRDLLEESERQAQELQTQQEELRVTNEELETQSTALQLSQHQLEQQQSELEQINDQLSEQSALLEQHNDQLTRGQAEIQAKSREVERASQFKSEFLSNMSHELRTPLNSSLILAKLLADNREGNLTAEQVTCAATIHAAGNDLLSLINDILDLSKVEAGKMDVHAAPVALERVQASLQRTFEPLARTKGLRFAVDIDPAAPTTIETDLQRLEQILRNLVSNALKFTSQGEVAVAITGDDQQVSFAVRDTGIGIAPQHQGVVFEAFQQADGTTSRKYGGTGLGLSISRELTGLLGGDLRLDSQVDQGSTFVLSLPLRHAGPAAAAPPRSLPDLVRPATGPSEPPAAHPAGPQPPALEPGQRRLLVIEDDADFAQVLAEVAREAGFACLVAGTARQGLHLARTYTPEGIVLDLGLPDHTGLLVLDRLKRDPVTRHIPVHIVSGLEEAEKALTMGAAAYLTKPVERGQLVETMRTLERRVGRRMRHVLVVDDDPTLRQSVARLLGREDIEIQTAASVDEALARLRETVFDCVVTDLGFPGRSGQELLASLASGEPYSLPPVIVYTGRELSPDEEQALLRYSRSIIVKGAHSPERLLDEVMLFLHQVESELTPEQQKLLRQARYREALFEGRTILVVEDDVRNVFALNNVLEPKGARVVIARNGREALAALEREPRIDLVLMDVMMPEMDGLEATRRIRQDLRRTALPIVMLTAKAMPDDQQRCLEAGASDYLAKPLDVEMLLSLLRVWMPRSQ